MAKRRRLTDPARPAPDDAGDAAPSLETKANSFGLARTIVRPAAAAPARAPIAAVAGEAAERAALAEVVGAFAAARDEGRIVYRLPLEAVEASHLVRDRLALDEAEMVALETSLRERGQQTPIEVVPLDAGRYGLVSGWRRLEALRRLDAGTVLALVRRPEGAVDTYRAMVEENEIRAGLSFYERARIAAEAARLGLYPHAGAAVAGLFAAAPAPKRSKISAFLRVHDALGQVLRFPAAIPEKLGLALAQRLADPGFATRLRDALRKTPPASAEVERRTLERALAHAGAPAAKTAVAEPAPGIRLETRSGRGGTRLALSGPAVTPELAEALAAWLTRVASGKVS